jgi:hypothetical protein
MWVNFGMQPYDPYESLLQIRSKMNSLLYDYIINACSDFGKIRNEIYLYNVGRKFLCLPNLTDYRAHFA